MSDLLSLVASPTWWVSVFVAGVLINLISAYLWSALINPWMARRSDARRLRLEGAEKERAARIEKIKQSDRGLLLAARRERIAWLWAILHLAVASVVLVTGNVMKYPLVVAIANLIALTSIFLGFSAIRRAFNISSEIDDATRGG